MRTLGNYDFILHFSCTVALRVKTEQGVLCEVLCFDPQGHRIGACNEDC